jgi:hypothetical protein
MKPVTVNVIDSVYTQYQEEARRNGTKTSELIRDAMTYYLTEKLEKRHTLDSWKPVTLGGMKSDYADNGNREELLDDRY